MPGTPQIGRVVGPLLLLALLLAPAPAEMPLAAQRTAAIAALMAVWWVTEAIPIPATALLPVVLFPAFGVMSAASTTSAYGNHVIYLFLGGFMIAVTMERWGLHKRLALHTIRLVGVSPSRIVLGFMLATAFLSMWISNTATTMMMVPIGLAVIGHAVALLQKQPDAVDTAPGRFRFGTALMLGIAYAASIGGSATLIGTPPNAILAGIAEKSYGYRIDFATWLMFGLPLATVFLVAAWLYLTRVAYRSEVASLPGGRELILGEMQTLGPMTPPEKRVLIVFVVVAGAWILRGLVPGTMLAGVQDSSIAVAGAVALFLIPAQRRAGGRLLDWATAVRIPWDVIVLFGGGFALAQGFSDSGLTQWLAEGLRGLGDVPGVVVVASVVLLVVFMTELTSNTATATLLIPLTGALATAFRMHPLELMVPTALAASYAFMLPVATPPNAIVFGSRYVRITEMAAAGIWMNLIGTALCTAFVLGVLPWLWDLRP